MCGDVVYLTSAMLGGLIFVILAVQSATGLTGDKAKRQCPRPTQRPSVMVASHDGDSRSVTVVSLSRRWSVLLPCLSVLPLLTLPSDRVISYRPGWIFLCSSLGMPADFPGEIGRESDAGYGGGRPLDFFLLLTFFKLSLFVSSLEFK